MKMEGLSDPAPILKHEALSISIELKDITSSGLVSQA